ncbi:hypothetical protein GCM10012275_64730 [Longimycelium tulufanense]|uniref:Uncharacterized protein n=1 Tax=Longimycelium tulufanense TaxID=907463 RepID=A0A8J3FYV6_9PSEU|nr:hypothetical protein [Longimycelium tulufanense]GGM85003.1 hypothetical protein GCM10012275_64730 [Longimycelium tulufanense]
MTAGPAEVPGGVNAHAARAHLVDYVASLRRDAELLARDGNTDLAAAHHRIAEDLSALLRRWDIAHGPHS